MCDTRAATEGDNLYPLMLWVKLFAVSRIHPQSNKFVTGVKTIGDSKLNDSP